MGKVAGVVSLNPLSSLFGSDVRDIADTVAFKFLGTPYIWAGDDPSGWDCSGFVIEILKSVGRLPRSGDWTANMLLDVFKAQKVQDPYRGCLVWWGTPQGHATHVEYCLDSIHSIGASGGGSATTTPAAAWKANAYVKIRPIISRAGIIAYADPF